MGKHFSQLTNFYIFLLVMLVSVIKVMRYDDLRKRERLDIHFSKLTKLLTNSMEKFFSKLTKIVRVEVMLIN